MNEDDLDFKDVLKGLKFTKLKFPCGLEIEITKELFKNTKGIRCPLHGKKCENISTRRIIGEKK